MWGGESECGLSVLARAAARPAIDPLHPALLPGLDPGDAVQVSGEACSGCSMLLYDLVARALLPSTWRGVNLGGCGAHVLFLDTDLHFCVLQLSVVAEGRVRKVIRTVRREMKAAAATCATGATQASETEKNNAVECENDSEGAKRAKIEESDLSLLTNGGRKSSSRERVSCPPGSSETVDKKHGAENQEIGAEVSNDFDAGVSAKVPEKQAPEDRSSHVSESHSSLTSPSTNSSSLQWLRKTPLVKLKRLIKELVSSCLANLVYLRCSYSTQFMTTLLSLDVLLAAHPRVSLICVDSLSNFYWHDRTFGCETWQNTEQYYNKIMKCALDCVRKNKVVFVGVQQPLFAKQKRQEKNLDSKMEREYEHYNFLGRYWAREVRYKIRIRRVRTSGRVEFTVSERDGSVRTLNAVYRADGITWLPNE